MQYLTVLRQRRWTVDSDATRREFNNCDNWPTHGPYQHYLVRTYKLPLSSVVMDRPRISKYSWNFLSVQPQLSDTQGTDQLTVPANSGKLVSGGRGFQIWWGYFGVPRNVIVRRPINFVDSKREIREQSNLDRATYNSTERKDSTSKVASV